MSTQRPISRTQRAPSNASSAAAPPRLVVKGQMDISSKTGPHAGSTPVASTNPPRPPLSTFNSHYNSNNNNSNSAPVRAPSVKVRTSNPVTTASSRSSNVTSSSNNSSRKDGGSVTSDDGTVSEDSDLARDELLFTGGQANVGGGMNLSFSSGRPASAYGSLYGLGSKQGTAAGNVGLSRHRSSSSIVGFGGGSSVGTTPKPIKMAAGAAIMIDSASLGLSPSPGPTASPNSSGPTSSATMPVWSTPSSPSLSRNGSFRVSGGGGGDDGSSTVSTNSTNPHHPSIRSTKSFASIKPSEENRRAEEAARTKRKIQDLEISNNSLLSLNQSLEATNRKLATEIQELKMRIQSAHLGELGHTAADVALAQSVEAIELTEEEKNDDLTFKRLCSTIEQLMYEAKHALDQTTKLAGVKVLSLYDMYEKELEDEDEDEEEGNNIEGEDTSFTQGHKEDVYSMEVIEHEDDDDSSAKDKDSEDEIMPYTIGNRILTSSAIMEAPLAIVV
ncbi:hypothetical protein BGZ46_004467 [Entomortierella lignicola]|nr:hypothetical protein BGZ46_004467 [Entomortierella lignicola]